MAWPPITHQDVQDAVTTLQTAAPGTYNTTTNPPPDTSDPLSITTGTPVFTGTDTNTYATTTTLTGATYLSWNDSRLTYRGTTATEMIAGSAYPQTLTALPRSLYGHVYGSQQAYAVEFYMDGASFEFGGGNTSAAGSYRLLVNGRRVTDVAAIFVDSPLDQHERRVRVDFGSAIPRRITLEVYGIPLFALWVQGNIWSVPSYRDRTIVLGDSISGGSNYNTGLAIGTWVNRTALTLGWDDPWNQSIGGTGYISVGQGTTFANRVQADVIAYAPTRVIVWGGYNDNTGNQSTISTAATSLYQTIKAGLPSTELIVIGCYSPTGTPAATITSTDNTLQAAAAAAGVAFISPLTGKVYNARGTVISTQGAFMTTANQAAYISADGVHPNDAGHNYLAGRIRNAIQSLYAASSSVEPWAGGLHAAIDDGEPSNDKEWNYLSGPSTLATLTPTALTVTAARCWSYNCMFPIVVNRLRWYGIGATTTHRLAVYRLSDGVQVIGPLSLTTTADAWNSVAVSAATLAPNTAYIVALSTTTTGTTAGLRSSGTPLLYPPLQGATSPGGIALTVGDHRFWFGQFAVTNGVLPATLPTLVRGTGWTAGLPLFFFDSNAAA